MKVSLRDDFKIIASVDFKIIAEGDTIILNFPFSILN